MEQQVSQLPPNIPVDPPPPVVVAKTKVNKTIYFIIGGIVLFILIIVTGLYVGFSLISKPVKVVPTPIVTPPPPPVVEVPRIPSKFASDSALLKIREDIKKTQADIDTVDLFDAQISPPTIDLGIQIQ